MALFKKNKGGAQKDPRNEAPIVKSPVSTGRPPLTPTNPPPEAPEEPTETTEPPVEAPAPEPAMEAPVAAEQPPVVETPPEAPEEPTETTEPPVEAPAPEPAMEAPVAAEQPPVVETPPSSKEGKKSSEKKDQKKSSKKDAPVPTGKKKERPLPRVLAVANQKGGVGKTTTTVNLGAALAELGYRVLVIDLDPQGNATTGLGIERHNFEHSMYDVLMREQPLEDCIESTSVKNLFVAPATLDLSGVDIELVSAFNREARLKRAIEPILEDFDFVLIDCPPSLGLITINALTAAREVLVPIQCEYFALEGLSQLRTTLQLVTSNLNESLELSTIVLTMYDSRTNLAQDVADDVRSHFPDEVCATVIPRTVRLSEAPSFGQPITVFDTRSVGAESYRNLAKEVANGAPKRAG